MEDFGISLTLEKLQGHSEAEEGVSMRSFKGRKAADLHTPTYTETTFSTESTIRGQISAPSSIYRVC
jgi:hypothetical protein